MFEETEMKINVTWLTSSPTPNVVIVYVLTFLTAKILKRANKKCSANKLLVEMKSSAICSSG